MISLPLFIKWPGDLDKFSPANRESESSSEKTFLFLSYIPYVKKYSSIHSWGKIILKRATHGPGKTLLSKRELSKAVGNIRFTSKLALVEQIIK